MEHVQANIASFDQHILNVEKEMDELVDADDDLKEKMKILKEKALAK